MADHDGIAFEIDAEDGAECVVLWRNNPEPGPLLNEVIFKVGEPVHLKWVSLVNDPEDQPSEHHTLWWIQGFNEEQRKALVSEDRAGDFGDSLVSVQALVKLNAMERLAAEYAF